MMLNFVCYLDGNKHSGSTDRAAHPLPTLSCEYIGIDNNSRVYPRVWQLGDFPALNNNVDKINVSSANGAW